MLRQPVWLASTLAAISSAGLPSLVFAAWSYTLTATGTFASDPAYTAPDAPRPRNASPRMASSEIPSASQRTEGTSAPREEDSDSKPEPEGFEPSKSDEPAAGSLSERTIAARA